MSQKNPVQSQKSLDLVKAAGGMYEPTPSPSLERHYMTFLEMINSKDRSKFALPNEALPSKAIGKCEACTSWQFSSITEAKRHISIFHRNYKKDEMSSLDQSVFTCKYKGCSMKFSTQYQLANHKSNSDHYIRKRPNSSKKMTVQSSSKRNERQQNNESAIFLIKIAFLSKC